VFFKYLTVGCLFLSIWATRSEAHPVAYAGSSSIMTWNSKDMSEWMFVHSFTTNYALMARYERVQTKDRERTFYIPQVNFLLKRWNELESQANIYLSAGHGGEKINSSLKDTSAIALETDWESRKYYTSFKEDVLISHKQSGESIYYTRARAGFAPYLAEFNEINTWFILQAEHSNKSTENFELTPMIRVFYHNVLAEIGVSARGNAQFNFMVHF
jgi:hypothetical protein